MRQAERLKRQTGGKGRVYARRARDKDPAGYAITRCRQTAKKKGLEFDLDQHREELAGRIAVGRCELTGIPLRMQGPDILNQRRPDALSIDRIDSSKGYTIGNVRIVCLAINLALGNWGEEGLRPILQGWWDKQLRSEQ